ncbi:uncharacterized protein LOC143285153 [Babylonia areolata]|uniref:uncharacterized protein LOC143285153 n=1 Tax=Babylonia areolata TaxID=304850 RepID=UPI003FD12946
MPQVWNPSVSTEQDSGGFSKNSRFMKLSNFSDASLRRIKVRNSLEAKLSRIQQAYIHRHSSLSTVKIEQARKRIVERYRRYTAYKLVVQKHPIQARADYQAALNDNYSLHAFRHELRRMSRTLDPENQRKRKAESLVQECRDKYADTVTKNREAIVDIVPKPKPDYAFEDEQEDRSPTPPPPPAPFRRSIVGPPLRGLANKAQAVTVQMVKENTWMSGAPSSAGKNLNPHAVLPPIK